MVFLTGVPLIVSKGGEDVILLYIQQELADHENSKILQALGNNEHVPIAENDVRDHQPTAAEFSDVCYRKQK